MLTQFLGKPFWTTLGTLAAIFAFAVLVFDTSLAAPALVAVGISVLALTAYRLEWGIAAAFAELFANSHGHLISADILGFPLSLRMAVFGGVMLGWIGLWASRRVSVQWRHESVYPFLALALAVGIGFAMGFAQNDRGDAFSDGNAYLYIAYLLPILSIHWTAERRRLLLQVLAASAAWVFLLTAGLLYIFTHFPEWMLVEVYRFIRDTRTGELTKMVGQIFRVFLQAQFSVMVMTLLLMPLLWLESKRRSVSWRLFSALTGCMIVILMSLSRSFWMGLFFGGLTLLGLVVATYKPTVKRGAKAIGWQALTIPAAMFFLILVILFPLPYRVGSTGDLASLFSSRTTETDDVAISSRWNLLGPMIDEVKARPILGSGFGETVTFTTDDPRARAINPDGTWTTFSLEWGWLELWIKMGILGPIAFLWLFVVSVLGLMPYLKTDRAWLGIGLLSALVMLYVTHVFSPYLNHPIGLGFLLFLVPFYLKHDPLDVRIGVQELLAKQQAHLAQKAPVLNRE